MPVEQYCTEKGEKENKESNHRLETLELLQISFGDKYEKMYSKTVSGK